MNKKELVELIAGRSDLSKANAEKALNAFLDIVKQRLADRDPVQIVGFGTFEAVKREAREARNPQTGETIHVPESYVPKFKPGKALKDAVK